VAMVWRMIIADLGDDDIYRSLLFDRATGKPREQTIPDNTVEYLKRAYAAMSRYEVAAHRKLHGVRPGMRPRPLPWEGPETRGQRRAWSRPTD